MKTRDFEAPIESLLFVCYGNTCRSPMAEGLAKKILPDKIDIESAGLSPVFEGAVGEAVEIMKDLYGIDISSHRTRSVSEVEREHFDYIIILDAAVYEILKYRYPILLDRLILWDIADPFGQSREAYERAAEKIRDLIQKKLVPHVQD